MDVTLLVQTTVVWACNHHSKRSLLFWSSKSRRKNHLQTVGHGYVAMFLGDWFWWSNKTATGCRIETKTGDRIKVIFIWINSWHWRFRLIRIVAGTLLHPHWIFIFFSIFTHYTGWWLHFDWMLIKVVFPFNRFEINRINLYATFNDVLYISLYQLGRSAHYIDFPMFFIMRNDSVNRWFML